MGFRMLSNKYGRKERWTCNQDNFPEETSFPRLYALIEGQYYKLSPFVMLLGRNQDEYVFSSLEDSLSGSVRLCPLFECEESNYLFPELIAPYSEDDRLISTINNTIMNTFDKNFSRYHDIGIKKIVLDFLKNNKASVSATIWGHGGVGKTACIQCVCQELFDIFPQVFAYIIFITAKDRIYNTPTGKIVKNDSNYVRHYYEIIQEINKTVFHSSEDLSDQHSLAAAEDRIVCCKQKILIVIDDYETFSDKEKNKINVFIKKLVINYHKVIITTRNTRFIIGETISSNELDEMTTQTFLLNIIKEEYQDHLAELNRLLSQKPELMKQIHIATSGRPIFIYQFAHLFVQEGFKNSLLLKLKDSQEAQDFLYGRLYDYLSPQAQRLFATISQAANSDMVFRVDMLAYLCSKCVPDQDEFDIALTELFNQKIIEHYGDSQARIYAPELLHIMEERFAQQEDAFRSTVKNLLNNIGGKNINGSIQQALLNEADLSRINGNMEDTVGRYRRVLKTSDAPKYIRRKALLNVASYLTITCLNPEAAANIIAEFLEDFRDDTQVCSQYVDYLWQQEESKEKADLFIRKFFSGHNKHKKTHPKYFEFFAKGVGYCSNYDMTYRTYENESLRLNQYNKTINEFGKILFTHVTSPNFSFKKGSTTHLTKVGLLQTLKLCRETLRKDSGKWKLAKDICDFADIHFSDKVYHNQFARIQRDIYDLNERKDPWDILCQKYKENDIIDGTISWIQPYGLFVKFDAPTQGFIHISQIKKTKYIDIYRAYSIGCPIKAQITKIDSEKKHLQMREV